MSVKNLFSKIGGFVTGFLPTILKFGEVFDLLTRMIKVGVAKDDVVKLGAACDALDSLALNLNDLGAEVLELSASLRGAIDASSEGGEDLTGPEIREMIDEAADIAPELEDIRKDLAELASKIKSAL